MTTALLLIDHGSRVAAANEQLVAITKLVEARAPAGTIVEHAHMELAEPSIENAVAVCAAKGATHLIAVPYMLAPGRHATEDIPRLVAAACAVHDLTCHVGQALGIHPLLAEVVLHRAGIGLDPPKS